MANEKDTAGGKAVEESSKGKEQASSGGRSEQNAQQRNEQQAKSGNADGDEEIRPPAHNVKSEPHWDPTEAPVKGGAKR